MKIGFSEFTYGFAVVYQLQIQRNLGFKAWPLFPSLRVENRIGADVGISSRKGIFFFLQFKLSEKMVNRNAIEFRSAGHGNPIFTSPPVYRFHLMPRRISIQHQKLLKLEKGGPNGRKVYYVAPGFDGVQFHRMRSNPRKIISDSVWVRPSYLGSITDDGPHHVSFDRPKGTKYTYSNPFKIDHAVDLDSFSKDITSNLETNNNEFDRQSLRATEEDILKIAERSKEISQEHIEEVRKETAELDAIQRISLYALNFLEVLTFGATIE